MREIRTSGSMSGDGKRSVAAWPKLPRPSSTLRLLTATAVRGCPHVAKADISVATAMSLSLRPTGLSSPAYRDWLAYVIVEDGRDVGRLYEDRHSPPEYRWFWSITVYVNPTLGIVISGRVPTIEEAKAQFRASWQKVPR